MDEPRARRNGLDFTRIPTRRFITWRVLDANWASFPAVCGYGHPAIHAPSSSNSVFWKRSTSSLPLTSSIISTSSRWAGE